MLGIEYNYEKMMMRGYDVYLKKNKIKRKRGKMKKF